jgi:hypothetical protein
MSIHKPQDPAPIPEEPDLPLDYWIVQDDNLNNYYYCNNNKIFYERGDNDKQVPNQLSEQDKHISNFSYPNDLEFGINYDRANSSRYRNYSLPGITYSYFLNTFTTE